MEVTTRNALQESLETLAEAGKPFESSLQQLRDLGKPHRDALAAIDSARQVLLDAYGVEIAGTCERCRTLLFAGELGAKPYSDDQGIIYCESCAPTWADHRSTLPADPADDADEQAVLRALINEIDDAGRLHDKAGLVKLDPEIP